ncbi:MAG: iron-only hydrogenase system regulator [Tissierellia bacterium]|nr:iron-only hydrogenase system regulator [Tissierellia bacterium]
MRIAIVGIFVEDPQSVQKVNHILHDYRGWVLGRMGLPQVAPDLNVICLVVKAPQDQIAAMTGKLGSLAGVKAKASYAKISL